MKARGEYPPSPSLSLSLSPCVALLGVWGNSISSAQLREDAWPSPHASAHWSPRPARASRTMRPTRTYPLKTYKTLRPHLLRATATTGSGVLSGSLLLHAQPAKLCPPVAPLNKLQERLSSITGLRAGADDSRSSIPLKATACYLQVDCDYFVRPRQQADYQHMSI